MPSIRALTPPASTVDREVEEIDLGGVASAVWRKRHWIIVPTLVAAVASYLIVERMTPYYRSGARLLVESQETSFTRTGESSETVVDQEAIRSQVQLLLSRDLARTVIARLELTKDPEFDPASNPSLPRRLLALVGLSGGQIGAEERTLRGYFDALEIAPVLGTRVISIEATSVNPETAAKLANTVAEEFLKLQQTAKQSTTRQATTWLGGEIESLRKRVADAEAKVEDYRAKAGLLVGSNNTTVAAQQLGDLSNQLADARSKQADAEAKAKLIRSMIAAGGPIEALDVQNSELIRRLQEQRVQLQAQLANESRTLLAEHPRIKALRAQLDDLTAQIRTEADKLAKAYENEASLAKARVAAIVANVDELKKVVASANSGEVELRALEREAKSQRDLLEQFLLRFREASARETLEALPPDARIISRAAPAAQPYFPRKLPTLILATAATLVISLVLVVAQELMFGMARRSHRVAGPVPAPPSVVDDEPPAAPVMGRLSAPLVEEAAEHRARDIGPMPETADARLIGDIANQLAGLPAAEEGLKLLVTSSTSKVASGPFALDLARRVAARDRKAVLIDAGGGIGPVADASVPGFLELARGEIGFTEAIHRDRASRLHVIPIGSGELPASFEGDRLGIVFDSLAETYDFVVVAVPSMGDLAAPAGEIGACCNSAILLATGRGTDQDAVDAHGRIRDVGIEDVALLLVPADPPPPGSKRTSPRQVFAAA